MHSVDLYDARISTNQYIGVLTTQQLGTSHLQAHMNQQVFDILLLWVFLTRVQYPISMIGYSCNYTSWESNGLMLGVNLDVSAQSRALFSEL